MPQKGTKVLTGHSEYVLFGSRWTVSAAPAASIQIKSMHTIITGLRLYELQGGFMFLLNLSGAFR